MTRRAIELQSDTRRPPQLHPPSASLRGGGEAGGGGGEERGGEGGRGEGGVGDGGRGGVLPKRLKFARFCSVQGTHKPYPGYFPNRTSVSSVGHSYPYPLFLEVLYNIHTCT